MSGKFERFGFREIQKGYDVKFVIFFFFFSKLINPKELNLYWVRFLNRIYYGFLKFKDARGIKMIGFR